MRALVNWKDEQVEYPNRYAETDLGDGLKELVRQPGEVREEGTPQNAANFNTMDLAAFEAMLIANENTRLLLQSMRDIDSLKGLTIDVPMTNTQAYPFNGSLKTVALPVLRNTADYNVVPEIISHSGGFVGDFVISDKLLNGFKIAYTGSATAVSVRCHVIGGM